MRRACIAFIAAVLVAAPAAALAAEESPESLCEIAETLFETSPDVAAALIDTVQAQFGSCAGEREADRAAADAAAASLLQKAGELAASASSLEDLDLLQAHVTAIQGLMLSPEGMALRHNGLDALIPVIVDRANDFRFDGDDEAHAAALRIGHAIDPGNPQVTPRLSTLLVTMAGNLEQGDRAMALAAEAARSLIVGR